MRFNRLASIAILLIGTAHILAPTAWAQFDKPNTERGNALLRELDEVQSCKACRVYLGHVSILGNWNGSDASNPENYDVFHQQSRGNTTNWVIYGIEATDNTLKKTSFKSFTEHNRIAFDNAIYRSYGGGWSPDGGAWWQAERFDANRRDQIVTKAISFEGINIEFLSFPFWKQPAANMFVDTGTFRCDGTVEYIFEQAGVGSGRGLFPTYLETCCIPSPANYVVNGAMPQAGTAPSFTMTTTGGGTVTDGSAISSTTVTITATESAFGSGIYAISLNSDVRTQGGALTSTETFSGLADGSYTATVVDLAGNQASAVLIISTSVPNTDTQDDKGGAITDVIPSSRCIVIHSRDTVAGIASISISGTGLSKTLNYSCGIPAKSTDVYSGAFCNLTEHSTYTYTVTSCSGKQTTSPEITIATSTKGGRICVTAPAGTFCGGTGALSDIQLRTYGTRMRVCLYTGSCGLCSITGYDNVVTAPAGSTYCGDTCCRSVNWAPPLGYKTFTVSNTTDVSNGDSGYYRFSITTTGSEGEVSMATLSSPNFKMNPGESTSGSIDVAQIGQGYSTDSSDGDVNVNSPFTRLHFSLRDLLEFLLPFARILLRASSPYIYQYIGSDAVFNSTTTLTFSYVDAVNTDTTTVRIYLFDGVSWSSAGITNQAISYSTTTHLITAFGSIDRTGLYATLYQAQDSSAPITTFDIQGSSFSFDGAVFVSTSSYLVLTATDPVVGGFASTVASVTYRIDPTAEAAFLIYTTSIPVHLGTHIFEYRSLDYAGNTEAIKTSTFTVTAGTALRTTNTAQVPGVLLNGFLGSGAKLEIESQAQNSLTLLISSVNRQGMVAVDNIGEVGIGVTPQTNLNIGQGSIALQLRSGNSTSAVTSNQIAFAYNGDNSMRHLLRTEHSTATHGNKLDFLVWNTGAASTTTVAGLNVLSLQGIASASGGSFHVQPVGEPDAEVEVSNGLSTGGGTMQRLQVVSPSSRRFKTDIKDLRAKDEDRALADVAALKHTRFRYKTRRKDGRLVEDPAQTLHTGLIYEEAPDSIREGGEALSTSERLVNVELALKASMRRLEELQARYERLKAKRRNP